MTDRQIRKHYRKLRDIYGKLGLSVAGDVSFLVWLSKEERALGKLHENDCNYGGPTGGAETRRENRYRRTIEAIEEAMPRLKGLVMINGDPRGAALKIDTYRDDDSHDSRHGCDQNPQVKRLIAECGLHTDWGGYGMLAPEYQL